MNTKLWERTVDAARAARDNHDFDKAEAYYNCWSISQPTTAEKAAVAFRFPQPFGHDFEIGLGRYEPSSPPPVAGELWCVAKAPALDARGRQRPGYVLIQKRREPHRLFFLSERQLAKYGRPVRSHRRQARTQSQESSHVPNEATEVPPSVRDL